MRIIVGCPIRDRQWILPTWFEYLGHALRQAGVGRPLILFIGDTSTQLDSLVYGVAECARREWDFESLDVDEQLGSYSREWNYRRYEHMAVLRNTLLQRVRMHQPELYWSLDSDILVAERSLEYAIEALKNNDWAAVGLRCYLSPQGTACPSYAMLNGAGMLRHDGAGTFPVEVIMASKVLTPAAYSIDYVPHQQGEDIGWSEAVRAQGLKLGWDGRSVSKHVMSIEALAVVDDRCGF